MGYDFIRDANISRLQKEIRESTRFREMYERQGNKEDAARHQKYIDRANASLLAEIAKR